MLFSSLYQDRVYGVIAGLDRVRFRGTERMLSNESGFRKALCKLGVLLKDFGVWAEKTTRKLRFSCERRAESLCIPVKYLNSGGVDKEALARHIAEEEGVAKDGSICMLSTLEMCVAPTVGPNRKTKQLELHMLPRKCIFIYHYFDHPQVGFGHVRLQTWAPYTVTICLNGRHWLEKQLLARKVAYYKAGNCFPWIGNIALAQELLDAQLSTNWPAFLNGLALNMCPDLMKLIASFQPRYYWSADETEFATDVMFRSKTDLDVLFPRLLSHGMRISDCHAVLRYFGRRSVDSSLGTAPNQVQSDCRRRHEGLRIKHFVNGDSIKMYNKEGTVLRVETTINNARNFKAFRPANDDESKPSTWQKMRKGVNDLHRRCEVSEKANERYLNAISAVEVNKTLHQVAHDACNRKFRKGRSVRGINPWNEQDFPALNLPGQG